MAQTTKTVLHRRVSYRALVAREDEDTAAIEIQSRQKSGDWSRLALGMFDAGGLDCGQDNAKVPTEVFERLHDMVDSVLKNEGAFEDDDDV